MVSQIIVVMEVNRLLKDELLFEVGLRGLAITERDSTVADLRVRLRELLAREADGEPLDSVLNLSVKDELLLIQLKLQEVDLGISDVETQGDTPPVRVRTLLSHLNRRLAAILPLSDGSERVEVKKVCDALGSRVRHFRTLGREPVYCASSVVPHSSLHLRNEAQDRGEVASSVSEVAGGQGNDEVDGEGERVERVDREERVERGARVEGRRRGGGPVAFEGRPSQDYVRVNFSKWGLSFSGEDDKSVNSFLTDLEEKAETYGVRKCQLLNGMPEFLVGAAKLWYRTARDEIDSWDEFKFLIRKEYLPLDYQRNLWDEIRTRVQGPDEPMGTYVAKMLGLFERLSVRPREEEKLEIILGNLHPYYTDHLALTKVLSIRQLKELGKELEVSRYRAENYRNGNKPKGKVVESEFAYKQPKGRIGEADYQVRQFSRKPALNELQEERGPLSCWNCGGGHRFSRCDQPRSRKFCYACGRENVTKRDCPVCASKGKEETDQLRGN